VVNPFPQDNGPVRGNVLTAPVQSVRTNALTDVGKSLVSDADVASFTTW
jgi:hypothetical protein